MSDFVKNKSLIFKYIYWFLIFIGILIATNRSLFGWGGFTEPIDIHVHIDVPEERDYERELTEWLNTKEDENEE
ncbi:MAG: hypothetical protein ACE5GV_00340 [Candidatus Scalindua sp.]